MGSEKSFSWQELCNDPYWLIQSYKVYWNEYHTGLETKRKQAKK